MKEPDVVPDKLKASVNLKILVLIIATVIAFQGSLYLFDEDSSDVISSIVSFVNPLAASIAGFIIAKRYAGTQIFGKSYFSLALAYFMFFLAEVSYLIYDLVLGIDPYPSIADVFFLAWYPLAMIFLILNIRFFAPKFNIGSKVLLVGIPVAIISAWTISAYTELGETSFDFYFGLLFIIASSITLSFGILAATIFRQGVMGVAWLILVIGIMSNTIGDVWYYYIEIFGEYSLLHPVNVFWYASIWVTVYALIKHKNLL